MNTFEVDVLFISMLTSTPSTVLAAWDRDGDGVVLVPLLETQLWSQSDFYLLCCRSSEQ